MKSYDIDFKNYNRHKNDSSLFKQIDDKNEGDLLNASNVKETSVLSGNFNWLFPVLNVYKLISFSFFLVLGIIPV